MRMKCAGVRNETVARSRSICASAPAADHSRMIDTAPPTNSVVNA
jgi:hypothetical protein